MVGYGRYVEAKKCKDLAVEIGVSEKIAWLYPAIIDGAIIVFSLSVLRANLAGGPTIYPWILVGLFTLLSVVLNIIHAKQLLLAQFLAAIPPIVRNGDKSTQNTKSPLKTA